MLKYLEQLTVDLMIPAIVIGMLYAFIKFKLGKPCRMIYLAGGGFSVAASVFVAIQKNTNRELKLPFWNGFTYIILSVLVISSAVFILSMFVWLAVKKARKATRFFVTAAAATVTFRVQNADGEKTLSIVGVYDSGGDEDEQIFTALPIAQELGNCRKKIDSIEVSALTTPDNELAKKAATKGPSSLSPADYETWYCTAYVSSICYQIQEAIPDSVASPVRQVAESEGNILDKTQLLMILITILSLFGSALGISNLVTASVMERSNEIGLLKAIGARDYRISGIVLTEITVTAIVGGVAGYFMGYGFAQIIGQTVFNSSIEMKPMVIPIVAVLIVIVTLAGSIPAIRMLLRLRPAEVLHGR